MPGMSTYDFDVIAWAQEQARLLRNGQFALLDIEHIAEEIEDVGKSEQRELESRLAVLLAHLLKWQYQPERRGNSWKRTIIAQRNGIALRLKKTPSLKRDLLDDEWWHAVWDDAISIVLKDVELDDLPIACPWVFDQIISAEFWPD